MRRRSLAILALLGVAVSCSQPTRIANDRQRLVARHEILPSVAERRKSRDDLADYASADRRRRHPGREGKDELRNHGGDADREAGSGKDA